MKVVILSLFGVLLVGCASQSEMNEVRALADSAYSNSAIAARAADDAIQCCVDQSQRLDRMYQKIMGK